MQLSTPFDWTVVRRSAVLRKGYALSLKPLIALQRPFYNKDHYATAPPIVVNSLPKSGTHLMLQITRTLPGSRYLGNFIATTPSLSLKERSPDLLSSKIMALLPSETLGAHLYYSNKVASTLNEMNAIHIFMYRDPRAVLLSEIFYLTEMNVFHRMHKHFSKLDEFGDRLNLALEGFDALYPKAAARYLPYADWIENPNTLSLRYEDLMGPNAKYYIAKVAKWWRNHAGLPLDSHPNLEVRLANAIDPTKSHTFREGGADRWRRNLTALQKKRIDEGLEEVVDRFKYVL